MITQTRQWGLWPACLALAVFAAGCAEIEPRPFKPSEGHLQAEDAHMPPPDTIPDLARQTPILPEPSVPEPLEKYTVVVNEVPVRELLFALARDADLNVDIYPGIEGLVTLNAVDATLPKILDRISRQVDIRYEFDDDTLIISPDRPFFRSYRINYVNMSRDTTATNRVATQISTAGDMAGAAGGGGGGGGRGGMNTATTDIESLSYNRFWQTLVSSISAIIGDDIAATGAQTGEIPMTANVIASPETGIIKVRATGKEHASIREYVDQVVESAQRQVLIQATIVEVELSDQYQAGIDWEALDIARTGLDIVTTTLAPQPTAAPFRQMQFIYSTSDVGATLRLLEEFGATNVLSSPQLMVLNNQTAVLKVVENIVYFLIESEITPGTFVGAQPIVSVDTTPQTVPVGIVMAVTPQISETDTVTLNVRPTISNISEFVRDPNPNVGVDDFGNPLINQVPQIEVREMESMLRLNNGQTAILGGLMQDQATEVTDAIPGFSRIPLLGRAFRTDTRQYRKSELVIFLRPMVIKTPSIAADLQDYRRMLERPQWLQQKPGGGSP